MTIGAPRTIPATWTFQDEAGYLSGGGSPSSARLGTILADNDVVTHARMRRSMTQAIPYGADCASPRPRVSSISGIDLGVWHLPPTYGVREAQWVLLAQIELGCTIYACPYTVDGPQDTGWILGDGGADPVALVGAASPWGAGLPVSTAYEIPCLANPRSGLYGLALYSSINPDPGTFGGTEYGVVSDVIGGKILSSLADMGAIDAAGEYWAMRLTDGSGAGSPAISSWFQVKAVLLAATAVLTRSEDALSLAMPDPALVATVGWEARRVSTAIIHGIMLREQPLSGSL